jgi:hypothetical protein
MTAVPLTALNQREDLRSFRSATGDALLKVAIINGIDSIMNYYASSPDTQLTNAVEVGDSDSLLHIATRNQYYMNHEGKFTALSYIAD